MTERLGAALDAPSSVGPLRMNAPLAKVSRSVAGTQVGLLLGWMSTRVLGQYDPQLLGAEPLGTDGLYLVETNVEEWGRRADALRRLRHVLEDPATRGLAIETLRVELHGEHPGDRSAVATLLVTAGADLDASLLREMSGEHSEHWPEATLAALALSGRAAEAREAAERQGFPTLVRLLGDR